MLMLIRWRGERDRERAREKGPWRTGGEATPPTAVQECVRALRDKTQEGRYWCGGVWERD